MPLPLWNWNSKHRISAPAAAGPEEGGEGGAGAEGMRRTISMAAQIARMRERVGEGVVVVELWGGEGG